MTVQWYLHRIRKVIAEIRRSSNAALSSNLKQRVEDVLPGLRDIKEWDDFDWEEVEVAQQPAGVQVDAATASSLQDYYAALQSAAEGAGASASTSAQASVQGRVPLEITIQTLGKRKGKGDPQ